jgi:hypothetical protein
MSSVSSYLSLLLLKLKRRQLERAVSWTRFDADLSRQLDALTVAIEALESL